MPTNAVTERDARLAKVIEEPLEPTLPIIDPHHHLWDHPGSRYLLEEILRDTGSGHRVIATVFVECMSMYRADGDSAMKPVGETEFVNGIAAQSASGGYGDTRIAAGIVEFRRSEPWRCGRAGVASAYRGGAVRAFAVSATRVGSMRARDPRFAHQSSRRSVQIAALSRRLRASSRSSDLVFDAWQYHPQMPELTDLARAFPDTKIILDHFGGPLGHRSLRGPARARSSINGKKI